MSTLTMYDAIEVSQIPSGATVVAGYVSGDWPTYPELVRLFPKARILSIAVTAAGDAECLDVETGDAAPADVAGWYGRQKARGVTRPCIYASAYLMGSGVLPALKAAGISRAAVRLWSAHYTLEPHICGPSSCRAMSIDMDGTQWTDRSMGRSLDESLLLPDFFAETPPPLPPPDWQAAMLATLPTLKQGDADTAGHPLYVHRVQLLVSGVGAWSNLGAVTQLRTDGVYGPATAAGVKRAQQFLGITQDGICGPATWAGLVTGSA